MRADCSSYFVTMYMYTETTKGLQKKRDEKRRREKFKHNKPNSYT